MAWFCLWVNRNGGQEDVAGVGDFWLKVLEHTGLREELHQAPIRCGLDADFQCEQNGCFEPKGQFNRDRGCGQITRCS